MTASGYRRLIGAGLASAALIVGSPVSAQEVTFTGSTMGGFNSTGTAPSATLMGLVFNGSAFSETTARNFLAIGGDPSTVPGGNFNNFGSLALGSTNSSYAGNTFQLLITFTAPTGIAGGQAANFTSMLTGNVTTLGTGGVFVDFLNSTQVFTFTDPVQGHNSFTLVVNDVSVNPNQVASITGHITTAPEPATMTLLATGLIGLVGARARRRKATSA